MLIALLLVVVSIGIWQLTSSHRNRWLIAELVKHARHAEDAELTGILDRMSRFERPGMEGWVELAADPRPAFAAVVQESIAAGVSQWRRTVQSDDSRDATARMTSARLAGWLLESLSLRVETLDRSGRRWSDVIARDCLICTSALPASEAIAVIEAADRILAIARSTPPNGGAGLRASSPTRGLRPLLAQPDRRRPQSESALSPPVASTRMVEAAGAAVTRQTPVSAPAAPLEPASESTSLRFASRTGQPNAGIAVRDAENPLWRRWEGAAGETPQFNDPVASTSSDASATSPGDALDVELRASQVAAENQSEAAAAPGNVLTVVDVPGPDELRRKLRRYRSLASVDLLAEWKSAGHYDRKAIERVLDERGIARPESTPSRSMPSVVAEGTTLAERLDLLRRLMEQATPASRDAVRKLVDDPHPEVRREALTALAASRDPQVEEIARRRAIHDHDPQVAEVAARILSATLR
jgi:hypothetical protein